MLKISLFEAFYSNIARALAKKWIHEGILFIAWILILIHNKKDIKVLENSVKNFSDAHSPLMDTSDMSSEERFIKLSAIKGTSRVYQSIIPYSSRDFFINFGSDCSYETLLAPNYDVTIKRDITWPNYFCEE